MERDRVFYYNTGITISEDITHHLLLFYRLTYIMRQTRSNTYILHYIFEQLVSTGRNLLLPKGLQILASSLQTLYT